MLLNKLIGSPNRTFRMLMLTLLIGAPTIGHAAPAIVTGNVNVREGIGTRYKKIATLRPGWQVDAGPCQAGWCHVRVGRIFGWASARYLNLGRGVPVVRPTPYSARRPTVIIESGPVFTRRPYWAWGPWYGYDDWRYRRRHHHYQPPFNPSPVPPQPKPLPNAPHYNPYSPSPYGGGPGSAYPPMRNVPIGQGASPTGASPIGKGASPAGASSKMIPFGSGTIKKIVPADR